jgi:hypothetical protein
VAKVYPRRASLIIIPAFGLALALAVSLGLSRADSPLNRALDFTPTAYNYLPYIVRQATPSPSPTPPPPTPLPDDWLGYVNYYRALADLPPVMENAAWSDGCQKHARYMVTTNTIGHEFSDTPEGLTCAQNGVLVCATTFDFTIKAAIEAWMQGSFHAVPIINPAVASMGFGSYRQAKSDPNAYEMCAALNVYSGWGSPPPSVSFPVKWPAGGKLLPLTRYDVGEQPDPLASCPAGYSRPTGVVLSLQLGAGGVTPNVTTTHLLAQGGAALEHCLFDETSYVHPNSSYQSVGRAILDIQDAILIIPRAPLTPGSVYTVSVDANGQTHTWSFSVSSLAAAQALGEEARPVVR